MKNILTENKLEVVKYVSEVKGNKDAYQLKDANGALLVDRDNSMIATEHSISALIKVYEKEAARNSLKFYKD